MVSRSAGAETVLSGSGLNALRDQGRMTWIEQEYVWVAVPEDVVQALSRDGFEACKHEMTTSRRDNRPAGGLWQGINRSTGSVASAIWAHRAMGPQAMVFIAIDGEPLPGPDVRGASSSPAEMVV
jgi:hypothetical protein